jgi:predicted transposase YbfD/YdcC
METFSQAYKKKLNGIIPKYKEYQAPSHDTFRRVLGLLNPEDLQAAAAGFLLKEIGQIKKTLGIAGKGLRHLIIDGKEQKGTGRKYGTSQKVSNLQTLHCYDASNGVTLASIPISEKTNEIPTAQALLKKMQLKGCVVTFDAMNTQKATIAAIAGNKGDYVGGLKGNQQTFHDEVAAYFSDSELKTFIENESMPDKCRDKKKSYRTYKEKAHNRIEERHYYMTTDIGWFADLKLWPKLKSFICYVIKTTDLATGKKTEERRYYIASLGDIELCSDAIRGHWGIENKLHWHLDVTFSEDGSRTMDKNAFNNWSILNKMALSLLKLIQPLYKSGLKTIRKLFGWDLVEQLTAMLSLLDEETIANAMLNPITKTKK